MSSALANNNETYLKLKPWYEKTMGGNLNCNQIAEKSGYSYTCVLSYYSRYLRERFDEKEKERQKIRQRELTMEPICPTCGKYKSEVTDPEVCRDFIHFNSNYYPLKAGHPARLFVSAFFFNLTSNENTSKHRRLPPENRNRSNGSFHPVAKT